jgi:hypothetical protein
MAFAATTAFAAGTANAAEPTFLIAWDTVDHPGSFTLDFVDIGVQSAGDITRTQQALRIDGDTGLVSFIHYDQDVNELILPGGISTGAMRVEILESTGVSYDPNTGEFETDDLYAVHFEGDLSAFGITSPFVMPGASSGVIEYADKDGGHIVMAWEGEGFLPNPQDPERPLRFTYTCDMNNNFSNFQEADFFADADVDLGDYAFFQGCFGGADASYDDPHCELADFDFDGDVDLDDFDVVSELQTDPVGD